MAPQFIVATEVYEVGDEIWRVREKCEPHRADRQQRPDAMHHGEQQSEHQRNPREKQVPNQEASGIAGSTRGVGHAQQRSSARWTRQSENQDKSPTFEHFVSVPRRPTVCPRATQIHESKVRVV